MVLGGAFLLLVSLVLTTALAATGKYLSGLVPFAAVMQVLNFVISFAVITLLFAMMFKLLPDVKIGWSDVWIGAVITGLLFTLGKLLIGLYLGHSSIGSAYGAAGSFVVLLVWVYYSSQILFLGAEFTQVYANKYGSRIEPAEGAEPVTDEARASKASRERTSRGPSCPGEAAPPGRGVAQSTERRTGTRAYTTNCLTRLSVPMIVGPQMRTRPPRFPLLFRRKSQKRPFGETRRMPPHRSPRRADPRLAISSRIQSLMAGPHAGDL